MIQVYTEFAQGQGWLQKYQGQSPILACILGFTETGLIPGISAAGATPKDREYTAIADAEFLVNGVTPNPKYKLPPLTAGASPVLISRAVVEAFNLPVYLFNAGLPHPPAVSAIDLGGMPANCLTTAKALPLTTVKHLFEQGLIWGEKLADAATDSYVMISECVVGGTTTALSILTGLGFAATGKVNSSHPSCNHAQKWQVVQQGLQKIQENLDPLELVAAVGDPMQIAAAGMAISASRRCGVLLAGGTQMLAVYALARALVKQYSLEWQPTEIVVGTTRWVAEDLTGDTLGLAEEIGSVTFLASLLSFATSRYPQLQAYEQGYVKEGVGAGGCAIAAHLYQGWNQIQLLRAIEVLSARSIV